jgi:capsular exopolysaccharide synthesis family protein
MPLTEILALFWRRKLLLLLVAATAGAIGFLAARATPGRYVAEGLLLFDTPQAPIPELNQFVPANAPPNQRIRTEADVLRSRRLAEEVVQRTAVLPPENPGLLAQLPRLAMDKVTGLIDLARAKLGLPPGSPEPAPAAAAPELSPAQLQIEAMQQNLDIRTTDNSNVVAVRFVSTAPAIAAGVVNQLMERYIASDVAAKRDATGQANVWLTERLNALREEVEAADQRIQAFRRASGLLETSAGTTSTVQLTEEQTRVALARQDLTRAMAALENSVRAGSRGATSEAMASPVLQSMRAREAELVQRAAPLTRQLGANHPDRVAVESELRGLRSEIGAEVARLGGALRGDVDAARARLQNAQAALETSRNAARGGAEAGVTLAQLTRDAEARRQVYQTFMVRTEQTRLSTAQFPIARVISPAALPFRPIGPSNAVIGLFSGLVALLLTAALIVMRNSRRRTVTGPGELAMITGVQTVGSLPRLGSGRRNGMPNLVLDKGDSHIAETLRALRLNLRRVGRDGMAETVLITSPSVGDGKTTLAVALARLCAADGMKVLLLETDMRRPRIADTLGHSRWHSSIEAVLDGGIDLDDAVHIDERSGLHCLLSDSSAANPQQLLESPAFRTLLERARRDYQLVILDSPPIMRVADAVLLSPQCDVVLMAVAWERTPADMVAEAIRRLPEEVRSRAATVLTRVNPGKLDPLSYYAGYARSGSTRALPRLPAPTN